MGKRIVNADGTYRIEGKQRPGDGTWRHTASGWALDRMYDGQRLHVAARTQNEARKAMRELAGLARKNGYAIGICHYHRPNTATVVGEMITALKAEGIHFAFARDIND